MPNKETNRGGARPGAGKPKIEGLVRVQITITEKDKAKAKKLGNGNVSEGIRIALKKS